MSGPRNTSPPAAARVTVFQILFRLREAGIAVSAAGGRLTFEPGLETCLPTLRDLVLDREDEVLAAISEDSGVELTTRYLPMPDGVRLAVDLFRPAPAGQLVEEPLPVIWCLDRYHRSDLIDGILVTKLDTRPWLREVIAAGYIVASVDARGTGASTGTRLKEFHRRESQDAYEVTEWLASQTWCTGAVGMFGDSYLGIAQLLAAGAKPPHLRAIVPEMAMYDLYDFMYPGGIFRGPFARAWADKVRFLDRESPSAPVIGAEDIQDLASRHHQDNVDVFTTAQAHPFRDAVDGDAEAPYVAQNPATAAAGIRAGRVATRIVSGWQDIWVRDAFLWMTDLGPDHPAELVVGDCAHTQRSGIDMATEVISWFDAHLKGFSQVRGPRFRYALSGAAEPTWLQSDQWPPTESRLTTYTLTPSDGSGMSGGLDPQLVTTDRPASDVIVDYTATTGRHSRWWNGHGDPYLRPETTDNDLRCTNFDTARLAADLDVVGHPVLTLWLVCSHPDVDIVAYLEEVGVGGTSRYVTEGALRASHRSLQEHRVYGSLGLPWHGSSSADVADLPAGPVELRLDLHPVAYRFAAGSRVRLAIAGSDRDNLDTPVLVPAPHLELQHSTRRACRLDLPVFTKKGHDSP